MSTKLNKGDIIIFKAEDDFLSKTIAWLTASDVSHAAMVYSENSIVEVGAKGIGIHNVDVSNGRGAYIMRLSPHLDSAPLIQSADNYVQAKIKYDFPALFLLAGLLIQKKMTPTGKLISITNRILSSVCLELDKYIQKAVLHHDDRAMVCSQLVYQIFYNCGGKYQIQIKQNKKTNQYNSNDSSTICLRDLAENLTIENNFASNEHLLENSMSEQIKPIDEEDFKELYIALIESEEAALDTNKKLSNGIPNLQDSIQYARNFLDKTKHMLSLLNSDLPLDAMFVTPADLVYHAANLEEQGCIELTRIKK